MIALVDDRLGRSFGGGLRTAGGGQAGLDDDRLMDSLDLMKDGLRIVKRLFGAVPSTFQEIEIRLQFTQLGLFFRKLHELWIAIGTCTGDLLLEGGDSLPEGLHLFPQPLLSLRVVLRGLMDH
jgi:hypothetical protein